LLAKQVTNNKNNMQSQERITPQSIFNKEQIDRRSPARLDLLQKLQRYALPWRVAVSIGIAATGAVAEVAKTEAAGCSNRLIDIAFLTAPDPSKNPDRLQSTEESYVIPMDIPNEWKPGFVILPTDPKDPNSTEKVFDFPLEIQGEHSQSQVWTIDEPANYQTAGGPAHYFRYGHYSDLVPDPKTGGIPTGILILQCGEPGFFRGLSLATPKTLDEVAKNTSITGLKKVSDGTAEIYRAAFPGWAPRITLSGTTPEDNIKSFRAQIEEIKSIQEKIKKEELDRINKAKGSVSSASPSPRTSPSPSPSESPKPSPSASLGAPPSPRSGNIGNETIAWLGQNLGTPLAAGGGAVSEVGGIAYFVLKRMKVF